PNHGVNAVPQRIEVRDLVGQELDEIHHDGRADHDVVVEHLELRRQFYPAIARRQSQNGDGGVEIQAGGERKAERTPERYQVHEAVYFLIMRASFSIAVVSSALLIASSAYPHHSFAPHFLSRNPVGT